MISYLLELFGGWVMKLFIFIIINAMFSYFFLQPNFLSNQPILTNLYIYILYFGSFSWYALAPEAVAQLVSTVFVMFLSFQVAIWIIGNHHLPHHPHGKY